MALALQYFLFAFVIVTMLTVSTSQFKQTFLQQMFMDFLFPKYPGLVRVRRMDQAKGMKDNVVLDFIGMVEQYGYPAEEHNVTTEDGYHLKIHRIPGSPLSREEKKNVVFLQHGILASSDSWVIFGPGKDLAFLLADKGYDVWIGNIRGNSYARSHVNMTTYDRRFWQFSFHEMAVIDLPVMFDYVFNHTGQEKLHYVGHSMATTMLFTLLSMKPEYNAKIQLAVCLAPVAFWKKLTPVIEQLFYSVPIISELLFKYNIYDLFPQSTTTVTIGKTLCRDGVITQPICIAINSVIVGADPLQFNTTIFPYLLSHFPAGASIQTFYHFYQNQVADNFQSFDYGPIVNYKKYNRKTPITYDLNKITAPIALIYANNDGIATKANVLSLMEHLPNVVLIEEVPNKFFNHEDFLWGINAKTLLYDRVIELIQQFDIKENLTK